MECRSLVMLANDGPPSSEGIDISDIDLKCTEGLPTSTLKDPQEPKKVVKQEYQQWNDGLHGGDRLIEACPGVCPADNPTLFSPHGFSRGACDPLGPTRSMIDPTGQAGHEHWLKYFRKKRAQARAILDAGSDPHFSSMGWCQSNWAKATIESDNRLLAFSNPSDAGHPIPRRPDLGAESDSD